jgi:hypothetical protein
MPLSFRDGLGEWAVRPRLLNQRTTISPFVANPCLKLRLIQQVRVIRDYDLEAPSGTRTASNSSL